MDRTLDVVALGEAMVEFNQRSPGAPEYLQGFGGDTSNAVIAAARAGARTAYLTRVGGDVFGGMLLALWRQEGVATDAVEVDPDAPTGLYFVSHGPAGHAFTYRRAGSAAARMTPDWLARGAADVIRRARFLHVSGISMAISPSACETVLAAMRMAREAGATVCLDANVRLQLWPAQAARAALAQALPLADLYLPSLEDLAPVHGAADPARAIAEAHAAGVARVVVKLGGEGALLSDRGTTTRIAPRQVQVVDATGAGDCFAGNLLARLADGDDFVAAARYANAAAALAVQGYGAVAPLPGRAAVGKPA